MPLPDLPRDAIPGDGDARQSTGNRTRLRKKLAPISAPAKKGERHHIEQCCAGAHSAIRDPDAHCSPPTRAPAC